MINKEDICNRLSVQADKLFIKLDNSAQIIRSITEQLDVDLEEMNSLQGCLPDVEDLEARVSEAISEPVPEETLDMIQSIIDEGIPITDLTEVREFATDLSRKIVINSIANLSNSEGYSQGAKESAHQIIQLLSHFDTLNKYMPINILNDLQKILKHLEGCDGSHYSLTDLDMILDELRVTKEGVIDMGQFNISDDLQRKMIEIKRIKDDAFSSIITRISEISEL